MALSVNLQLFAASLGEMSLLSDFLQSEACCYKVPRTISGVLLSSYGPGPMDVTMVWQNRNENLHGWCRQQLLQQESRFPHESQVCPCG